MSEAATEELRTSEAEFLGDLGHRVRDIRSHRALSRKALAEASGLSERYIAQLEAGKGNVSVILLRRICAATGARIEDLFAASNGESEILAQFRALLANADPSRIAAARHALLQGNQSLPHLGLPAKRVALIGLRGAGKSTLGRLAADQLDWQFVELNREIERDHGLLVTEIFPLYGQDGYRRLEQASLRKLIGRQGPMLLATNGGLVSDRESLDLLLNHFFIIWLKASPQEHITRVRGQGKMRANADDSIAIQELRAIMAGREERYANAHAVIDTSGRSVTQSLDDLLRMISTVSQPALEAAMG